MLCPGAQSLPWSGENRIRCHPARPQSGPGAQQGLSTQKRAVFPTALRLLLSELRLPRTLATLAFVRLLHVLPTCSGTVASRCGFTLCSLDHKDDFLFFEGPAENLAHVAVGLSSLIGRSYRFWLLPSANYVQSLSALPVFHMPCHQQKFLTLMFSSFSAFLLHF